MINGFVLITGVLYVLQMLLKREYKEGMRIDRGKIIKSYIDEPFTEVKELSGGHINDTFLVKAHGYYVLQRLDKRLYSGSIKEIGHNYLKYRKACEIINSDRNEWLCPEWIRNREGSFFYTDNNGDIWRMYCYVEGDVFIEKNDASSIYEVGRGLGRLHCILNECDDIREPYTFRHLHDIDFYCKKYLDLKAPNMKRNEALDRIIHERMKEMREITVPSGSVIHGDAKCANMVFRGGKVVCFIDTDTIMQGSVYDDLADCARSCCIDENGNLDREQLDGMLKGYEAGCGNRLTMPDRELLIGNIEKNKFVLGLRYYIDHLLEEGYFTEQYSGQREKKAVKLLSSIL